MISTTTPAPLQRLRSQLDKHRIEGRRAVFPDELKWQAVALLNDFSASTVQHALRVSSSSLFRWKNQALAVDINTTSFGENIVSDDVGTFVSLPDDEKATPDRYPLTVHLGSCDSDQPIILTGEVTMQQWRDIVLLVTQALLP